MTKSWTLTVGLLLMLTPLLAVLADSDHQEARRLVESGSILPLHQVLEAIRNDWPGRILEVELEKARGSYTYEIELLDAHGKVWELEIDAVSGRVLETEEED